ncbi:MAG: hypothetical protein J0M10_14005 [Chitinophagales bacterium]|nr:hypothetical protein [Chitinophagales bacterium]
MIKRIFITTLLGLFMQSMYGQKPPTIQDSIATYFDEIKMQTNKHQQLWAGNLYSPMLLVNRGTRQVYANFSDTSGFLRPIGTIYTGILPKEINIANTAINWNGRRWAMIMLPLPASKEDRIKLLAHELFHVIQPSLGFKLFNPTNNHLDQKEGRVYLRLELEALKNALQATSDLDRKTHLTNALAFRKYRYLLYPGADSTENLLELNEGIAEYTGSVISGRSKSQLREYFVQRINSFINNPTFVRSFAYQTTPVYGYLLVNTKKYWNREVTIKTNLTDYFIKNFAISPLNDLKKNTDQVSTQYKGMIIVSEENAREEKIKKQIAEYKNLFITRPHFELVFEQMEVSFDPGNIIPVEDKGTVYPNIRVSDNWGILLVKNGALMSNSWDKISVTPPLKNEHKSISGDGWTLELKDGYTVVKDESTGHYKLTKQ